MTKISILVPFLATGLAASAAAQIESGVATSSTGLPAPPPAVRTVTQNAGTCSGTFIDFELGAPCVFISTNPLTSAYAAQGVTFAGPSALDGGAVLDQCGNFGINARSGTNFLAYNRNAGMQNGGIATDPQTMIFNPTVSSVSIYASGGSNTDNFTMNAFDAAGNMIATSGVVAGPGGVWTQVSVAASGIQSVVLTQTGDCCFVYDDLCIGGGGPGTIGTNYCGPAVANSTNQGAVMSATGSDVAASNNVTLKCAQMPNNQFGYFLNSTTQAFVFPVPGSQGALCLGGQIGRYNAQIQNSGAVGEISLALDLPNTPTPSGTTSILAGQNWNFTCWYRDNNPGPTSNFADGLNIQFN